MCRKTLRPSLNAVANAASNAGSTVRESTEKLPACVDCLRLQLMQTLSRAYADLACGHHHTDSVAAGVSAFAIAVVAAFEDLRTGERAASSEIAELRRMYDGTKPI